MSDREGRSRLYLCLKREKERERGQDDRVVVSFLGIECCLREGLYKGRGLGF